MPRGQAWSRSFISRGLADSYRAELVRATRQGLEFGPASGEPVLWGIPPVPDSTWYQHAVAFADIKWPRLAPHSRVTRAALDALMLRLDGSRAAASTIARKRAVFHDVAGYAVELGLLPQLAART